MNSNSFDQYLEQQQAKDPNFLRDINRIGAKLKIAVQLQSLRELRGVTQSQLARKLAVKQPNIARWENPDYKNYNLSTLQDIVEALNGTLEIRILPSEHRTSTSTFSWATKPTGFQVSKIGSRFSFDNSQAQKYLIGDRNNG